VGGFPMQCQLLHLFPRKPSILKKLQKFLPGFPIDPFPYWAHEIPGAIPIY
jgi:hypothetical protein